MQIQYEVWHFPQMCKGLFKDYVNIWLQIKQEASGWSQWVGADEEKRRQYIDKHEGVLMEYNKMEKNPELRDVAKMVLTSM